MKNKAIHFQKIVLLIVTFLSGCANRTQQDYYDEGQTIIMQLVSEFESVHHRQDLLKRTHRIQKLFLDLVNVMIAAHEFREKTRNSLEFEILPRESIWSDKLREELNRLYGIEGARDIIEKCQEEALYRLDAYEKKRLSAHK